jgi:hypothetical protein
MITRTGRCAAFPSPGWTSCATGVPDEQLASVSNTNDANPRIAQSFFLPMRLASIFPTF